MIDIYDANTAYKGTLAIGNAPYLPSKLDNVVQPVPFGRWQRKVVTICSHLHLLSKEGRGDTMEDTLGDRRCSLLPMGHAW